MVKMLSTTPLLLLITALSAWFVPGTALVCHRMRAARRVSESITFSPALSASQSSPDLGEVSRSVSAALGREVHLEPAAGAGGAGGGGASTSAVLDPATGSRYFVKSAPKKKSGDMLYAEFLGVSEIEATDTVRVPRPIAYGEESRTDGAAFAVLEFLDFCYGCSGSDLGKSLAQMHRCTSVDGYGFHVDNTIGATPQTNHPRSTDWAEFWLTCRLDPMLKFTRNVGGMSENWMEELRMKTRKLLCHNPPPSLLHGDLWGGNKGCVNIDGKKTPIIFDVATYYGDRETDMAMTHLFGGFDNKFYDAYEEEWPLPKGHEKRRTVYNLYHILNHYVLFGGSYKREAREMIKEILKY